MPLWLLANWKLIAAGAFYAASLVAVGVGVHNYVSLGYEAAISAQKAEAAAKLTELTERARKKETEDAENARNIDAVYQAMLNDAFAGRDAFDQRLRIARRGARCGGAGSGAPADTGERADPAAVSEPGPGSPDPAHDLRNAALELQRYAKACHSFAVSVGR